jgi:hypothetical protein
LKTDRKTIVFATILPLVLLLQGCTPTRVVMVPSGQPVRLAESVKAHVWAKDSEGKIVKSRNRVTIHEGWFVLPKD